MDENLQEDKAYTPLGDYKVERDPNREAIIREKISESLKMDGRLPSISPETKGKMLDVMARTVYEVCEVVGIDPNEIEYDMVAMRNTKFEGCNAYLRTPGYRKQLGEPNPDKFMITINEDYFGLVGEFWNTPLLGLTFHDDLRGTLAHELYHIRQAIQFPESFKSNHTYLMDNRVEIGARIFSAQYLLHRQKDNWRERLTGLTSQLLTGRDKTLFQRPFSGSGKY